MRGYGGIVLGKILNFKNLCIIFIFNNYFTEYSGILKMQQLSVITFDGVNKRINQIPWLMGNIHFGFLELINLLWKENNKLYLCLLLADNIMALTFSFDTFSCIVSNPEFIHEYRGFQWSYWNQWCWSSSICELPRNIKN